MDLGALETLYHKCFFSCRFDNLSSNSFQTTCRGYLPAGRSSSAWATGNSCTPGRKEA